MKRLLSFLQKTHVSCWAAWTMLAEQTWTLLLLCQRWSVILFLLNLFFPSSVLSYKGSDHAWTLNLKFKELDTKWLKMVKTSSVSKLLNESPMVTSFKFNILERIWTHENVLYCTMFLRFYKICSFRKSLCEHWNTLKSGLNMSH